MIHDENRTQQVWLYSHWGGYELPGRLQAGLIAGKSRWNDPSYLNKIIIGHAVPVDNWSAPTGYGISCSIQDNEHPVLVVDIPAQQVFVMSEAKLDKSTFQVPKGYKPAADEVWTFDQYCALTKLPWGEKVEAAV